MSVFLDTAILMYAGGGDHRFREPCQSVLQLVVDGRLPAVISAEIVQEILHRYTAIRRRDVGVAMARGALDLFDPVLPFTDAVARRLPSLVERYGWLPARDLVHVATCLEEGIEHLVSPDDDFDEVLEVVRIDPTDQGALAAHLTPGR